MSRAAEGLLMTRSGNAHLANLVTKSIDPD